jgi:hypothetical protein
MSLREDIAQQALSLGPEDRVYVADLLGQSPNAGGFATAEIATDWSAEIDRRIEAYDRGDVKAADFETALERIQQHLADHRSRRSAYA